MKHTQRIVLILMATTALSGCKKETELHNVPNAPTVNTEKNKYGVSVKDGTLKFESFEKYNELLNLPEDKKEEFYSFAADLPNFTSRNELLANTKNTNGKTTTAVCNCDVDDDYIQSIVDGDYMVIIEDFRVKLNGCNRMVYVSDELAAGAATRYQQMLACDFTNPTLYTYTFDQSVETELPLVRDSLNGTNIAGKRCTEVAISRRYDHKDAGTAPNGQKFPSFDLEYNNFGVSGRIRAQLGTSNNGSQWSFEWQNKYFKEKCGPVHNSSSSVSGKTLSGSVYKYDLHNGSRLTNAPTSTNYLVKMRLSRTSPIDQTGYIQIIP